MMTPASLANKNGEKINIKDRKYFITNLLDHYFISYYTLNTIRLYKIINTSRVSVT